MGYSLTYFPHFPFSTSFADTSSSNYSAMPEIHDCSTELCTKTVIIPFVVYVCREIKVLVSLSTSATRRRPPSLYMFTSHKSTANDLWLESGE